MPILLFVLLWLLTMEALKIAIQDDGLHTFCARLIEVPLRCFGHIFAIMMFWSHFCYYLCFGDIFCCYL